MDTERHPSLRRIAAAAAAALACPLAAAQGVASERELAPVLIVGARSPLDPNLPTSTYSITGAELARQPLINTQDALQYAPNAMVRKLRIGDTNGGIAGRSFGNGQPQRALAYLDGMLISNFLASHQVPRWSMADPAEVERIDVLYGPFSAIYPGNSIGTTVAITTRVPTKFEGGATLRVHHQIQDNYGYEQRFDGDQQSAYLGNRWGDLAASITLNRTRVEGHGSSYAVANRASADTGGTAVTGAVADRDIFGRERLVFGNTSATDATQTLAKLKLVYDFTPTLRLDTVFARFTQESDGFADTFLRDAAGNRVFGGQVVADGASYTLPLMGPRRSDEEHRQIGLRVRTRYPSGWNWSVQVSQYDIEKDQTRTSSRAMDASDGVVPGTLGSSVGAGGGGTGWQTAEVQAIYSPGDDGRHELTFGVHRNRYKLSSRTYSLADWHDASTRTAETANSFGKTTIEAIYAQDAWRFAEKWKATIGLRLERFEATDGSQFFAGANGDRPLVYPDRKLTGTSPKFSLSHALNDDWLLRASLARGVRFPTVAELFQGVRSGTEIVRNDPNLRAEKSTAAELTALRETGKSSLRVSLYQDSINDAIFTQQQIVASAVVSTKQNIDRTRVRGIEVAWQVIDLLTPGFDLTLNGAVNHARIIENRVLPASEGKVLPGVPKVRASALASYRTGPWLASLGVRHEGRTYSQLDNSDINPATFGGSNEFTVVDAKVGYQVTDWLTASLGANNLNNDHYYQTHPYAGRVMYVELNARF